MYSIVCKNCNVKHLWVGDNKLFEENYNKAVDKKSFIYTTGKSIDSLFIFLNKHGNHHLIFEEYDTD